MQCLKSTECGAHDNNKEAYVRMSFVKEHLGFSQAEMVELWRSQLADLVGLLMRVSLCILSKRKRLRIRNAFYG